MVSSASFRPRYLNQPIAVKPTLKTARNLPNACHSLPPRHFQYPRKPTRLFHNNQLEFQKYQLEND